MDTLTTFQLVKDFASAFSQNIKLDTIEFDGRTLKFELSDPIIAPDFLATLKQIFSTVNPLLLNKVEVVISSCLITECKIFYEDADYFKRLNEYKKEFPNLILLLLKSDGSYLIKDSNENFNIPNALLFNFVTYHEIVNFLKSNVFFTTLYNETNKQFIIVSKDNGVFYIGYNYNERKVKDLDDLSPLFEELKSLFAKKEFIQFFKEVITSAGIHEKDVNERLFEIIKNLKILLTLTEKDYDSYVLDFAFDKVKSKFKEERNKYFESLEKNIETVSKQVLSFPLTFAATVFASYQVKDKPLILIFIIVGYGLYTLLAFRILSIVVYNVTCLIFDVDKEEGEIKNAYNKLYTDFQKDFEKVRKKIKKLQNLIWLLKGILIALLLSFTLYTIFQITAQSSVEKKQTKIVSTENIKVNINVDSLAKAPRANTTIKIDSIKPKDSVAQKSTKP